MWRTLTTRQRLRNVIHLQILQQIVWSKFMKLITAQKYCQLFIQHLTPEWGKSFPFVFMFSEWANILHTSMHAACNNVEVKSNFIYNRFLCIHKFTWQRQLLRVLTEVTSVAVGEGRLGSRFLGRGRYVLGPTGSRCTAPSWQTLPRHEQLHVFHYIFGADS